ncbi:MAG: gamma-glutamylcyclotransferase family protein [Pirellulaceae bacterium]
MTIPQQFFVYGTLKRGLQYETVWPCRPRSVQIAWTRGTLFDRRDYPSMTRGTDRVLGEIWQFDAEQIQAVAAALDVLEDTNGNGPDDLYHRLTTEAFDLDDKSIGIAHVYHFVRDPLECGFTKIMPNANNFVAWPLP